MRSAAFYDYATKCKNTNTRAHSVTSNSQHKQKLKAYDIHTTWDAEIKNPSLLQGGTVRKENTQLRQLLAKKSNLATYHTIGNPDQ